MRLFHLEVSRKVDVSDAIKDTKKHLINFLVGREGSHGIEEYMNTKFIAFGGLV